MKSMIAGLILISLALVTGCIGGRPPEFTIANPYAVSGGSGVTFVAYQVNNGQEMHTYIQKLNSQGNALWGEKGIDLGPGSGDLSINNEGDFAALFPDGEGHVTVVFSQQHAVWVLNLDANGNKVQSARQISGSELPPMPVYYKAIGDNIGGVIVAWAAGENSLGLQKMDAFGTEAWSMEVKASNLDKFDISSDDGGNAFIIWNSEGGIFTQKVDAGGQVIWSNGGLQLTNSPGDVRGVFDQMIIGDGEGGAVVISMQAGQDLNAQRISSEGEMLWGENGVFVARVAHEPCVIGDAPENITVFWGDLQNVYAQRLDATGNITWPETGINIGQAGERNNVIHYYTGSDSAGGAVIVWNHAEGDNRLLHAQRVDAEGNKLWGDNGIKVSKVSPYWASLSTPARISPDRDGGFFVTLAAGKNIRGKTSSYIQRISGDGAILWGNEGIRLNP